MGFTPYDWNETIQHRLDYVEQRLRQGSPVVGLRFDAGLLLMSVRKTQRKVFEVFDHILYSAIGSQSDVEAIRIAAIDFAHQEAFNRSPDDVSVQRLAAGLSPTLKKAFADGFSAPFIFRGLFGELGRTPEKDQFTTVNYDGEYSIRQDAAAVAGSDDAEQKMLDVLDRVKGTRPPLDEAVRLAVEAWSEGRAATQRLPKRQNEASNDEDDQESAAAASGPSALTESLKDGAVEVAVLERRGRDIRFRLLNRDEIPSTELISSTESIPAAAEG